MSELLCFYVPCPDEQTAQKLIEDLIEAKLIACGNVLNAKSTYLWEENLTSESEYVAIMKSLVSKEQNLESKIMMLHPYEVPCIARWEVRCNVSYLNWIKDMLGEQI